MVHPFHPWRGREFEFVQRRKTWDVDRAFFRVPGGGVVSLPAAWTDAVAPDPFVVVAGGRVPFRTADLLAAAELVSRLKSGPGETGSGVRKILS
ncbi:MAG TPA: DUF5372 family protein [Streptosporangiaceae bacterium]